MDPILDQILTKIVRIVGVNYCFPDVVSLRKLFDLAFDVRIINGFAIG